VVYPYMIIPIIGNSNVPLGVLRVALTAVRIPIIGNSNIKNYADYVLSKIDKIPIIGNSNPPCRGAGSFVD